MSTISGATWPESPVTSLESTGVEVAVVLAVKEAAESITDLTVITWPDGSGGAFVVVDDVPLGDVWVCDCTWLGLRITSAYPEADAYPLHVRGDLRRRDGAALEAPFSLGQRFADRDAVSLSRSNPRRAMAMSTAAVRLINTIDFLGQAS